MNFLTLFRKLDWPILKLEIALLFRANEVFAGSGQSNHKVAGGIGLGRVLLVSLGRSGGRKGDASAGHGCAVFIDDSTGNRDLQGTDGKRENKQTRYEPPPGLHGGTPNANDSSIDWQMPTVGHVFYWMPRSVDATPPADTLTCGCPYGSA